MLVYTGANVPPLKDTQEMGQTCATYEQMRADTLSLAGMLPEGNEARARIEYLAREVGSRSLAGTLTPLNGGAILSYWSPAPSKSPGQFLVIDKGQFEGDKLSDRFKSQSSSTAFVIHADHLTLLAIDRNYTDNATIGNGLLLSHELTHVTEREDGLYDPNGTFTKAHKGKIERRAYELNTATFRAMDGDVFDQYAMFVPHIRTRSSTITGDIAKDTSSDNPFRPPRNTFIDEAWCESEVARGIILNAACVLYHETMTWKHGDYKTNLRVGQFYSGNS